MDIASQSLLMPFQAKWVRDNSRFKLCEKARQIGMTRVASALKVVLDTCQRGATNDTLVTSRDESLASNFKEACSKWAAAFTIIEGRFGRRIIDTSRDPSSFMLQFANGRRIYCLSSNPDAQAGRPGNRFIDEFALHPQPKELYNVAYHGTRWGGSMSIISTHRGIGNYFNELIEEARNGNPKGFSLHRVTLQDALEQGLLARLKSKAGEGDPIHDMDEAAYFDHIRAGSADEQSFLQEQMCVPENDADSFLPYELLDACCYETGQQWETDLQDAKGRLYVGVDIGRVKDLTCIAVIEKLGDVHYLRRLIELAKTPFERQEGILYPLLALPQMRRACLDQTGMGMQFAERAAARHGEYRVEGVTMTNGVKQELAYPVKECFEKKTIRIPNMPKLIADLHSVKKETTAAGNIRFAGNSDDSHADRFWALALALHASKEPGGEQSTIAIQRGQFKSTRM